MSAASDIAKPGYLSELLTHWKPLLAAMIGLGSGYSTTGYITSIMAPELLREFGWSKSEFALIGVLGLLSTPILNPPQSGILGMHKIMPHRNRHPLPSRSGDNQRGCGFQ